MRFLMVCTFYPPYSFGGDAISIREWSQALVRRGHHVTVVHAAEAFTALHPDPLPPQSSTPDDAGIEVIALQSRWPTLSAALVQQVGAPVLHRRQLRHLLQHGGFDVVVYHNPSLIGGPGMLAWPTPATTVYVAREHWLVCATHVLLRNKREPCTTRSCLRCSLVYRRPPQLWRYTGAMARGLAKMDLVIALSEFSRDKHREGGVTRPMAVLPNFVPDQPAPVEPFAEPHGPARRRPYFLFVGRLERIKGLDDVIPLFRALPDVDLLIVGEGSDGDRLREVGRDMPNVHFLGRIAHERVASYYRDAIATVVPSMGFEAFARVLIESMQAGVPFVARRIGPAVEVAVVSGAGELFATPEELLLILRRLVEDRGYRDRLASRALPAVATHWSETVVVEQFLAMVRAARERGVPAGTSPISSEA
ncbi:MAG: glycosyltransferase family 4 protein [Gemmatimonadales bacterium]|nr:glycosyltransferase family 4 protein [Gemmatimonadales bacterium]